MYRLKKFRFQIADFRLQIFLVSAISIFLSAICHPPSAICSTEDFVYNSKGKRDPFIPLIGPGAVYMVKEAADITSIEDVVLEGIVNDAVAPMAIINGIVLKEGDQAGIITVDKIESDKVILHIEDTAYEVVLGKEKGGEEK